MRLVYSKIRQQLMHIHTGLAHDLVILFLRMLTKMASLILTTGSGWKTTPFQVPGRYNAWIFSIKALISTSCSKVLQEPGPTYRTQSGDFGNYLADFADGRWTTENPSSEKPRTFNREDEYWISQANTYWYQKYKLCTLEEYSTRIYFANHIGKQDRSENSADLH